MLEYAAKTHPGVTHEHNEDSVGCDPERGLWLVADGMGGHAAGEVASKVAVDTILQFMADEGDLLAATRTAHKAIVEAGAGTESQRGMGSTSVALGVSERRGEIVWVGDSRAYLWRSGALRQLTKDHSFMQMLIDRQHLTPEQARAHPRRNVVTQVLGFNDPTPDRAEIAFRHNDVVLLCSDGLYDELDDAEIVELLSSTGSLEEQAQRLIDAACDSGGRDNISVVLVRYSGEDADTLQRKVGAAAPDVPPAEAPLAAEESPQQSAGLPPGVLWGILTAVVAFLILITFLGGEQ